MINFGRHKILECAKEILEKSQNMTLDKDSFIRISDDLEVMLSEVSILVSLDEWIYIIVLLFLFIHS